jgi:hypothetical protein
MQKVEKIAMLGRMARIFERLQQWFNATLPTSIHPSLTHFARFVQGRNVTSERLEMN